MSLASCTHPSQFQNALLRSMTPGDIRLLHPHLARVCVKAGDILVGPGAAIERVFFPETAVISLINGTGKDRRPDVGLIGREGMLGWATLMGDCKATMTGVVRLGGTSLAISAKPLIQAAHISGSLRAALLASVHDFMSQMAGTILSTCEPLERRVARWLIMLHDRSEGDVLALTHDHIRRALHVRRASVTDTVHILEGYGALKCSRSRITVRDRARLELAAGMVAPEDFLGNAGAVQGLRLSCAPAS